MRYEPSPGCGRPIVVGKPRDVMRLIPDIERRLRFRYDVPDRDVRDLAQEVASITCTALEEGRVRGVVGRGPRRSLMAFMVETAWRVSQNYKRLRANVHEVLGGSTRAEQRSPRDLVGQVEARATLARLAQYPEIAAFLVDSIGARPEVPGRGRAAGYFHLARFRRWLREVHESGVWREPPQPIPPDPRDRKRGR